MAKIWGLFHGGYSYSAPEVQQDTEEFHSLASAKAVFESRSDGYDSYFPAVDYSASMQLFKSNPRHSEDPYPDAQFIRGPRGGVRMERC